MEEQPRTRPHTVTTTASSFAENFSTSSSSFAYDREFLRTAPGLLIVAEIVSAGPGGGGGDRGAEGPARAPGPGASAGPRTGLFAPSRLLPKAENSATASPSEVQSSWGRGL